MAECPYCGAEEEICHDDGYGYSESEKHNQECGHCGKTFVYNTSIVFYYDTEKAECLNGGEHQFKATATCPREYTQMMCTMCGETRQPTKDELELILAK